MYYDYRTFIGDLKVLKSKIEQSIGIPHALVGITRGGMTMTHFLSLAWNIRAVYGINAISYSDKKVQSDIIIENIPFFKKEEKNILIIDEIIDSGKSLFSVLEKLKGQFRDRIFYSCSLFQKKTAIIEADFWVREPNEWIDFFWEVDILGDGFK